MTIYELAVAESDAAREAAALWDEKALRLARAYGAACAAVRPAYDAWLSAQHHGANTLEYERAYCAALQRAANARRALLEHASGGEVA